MKALELLKELTVIISTSRLFYENKANFEFTKAYEERIHKAIQDLEALQQELEALQQELKKGQDNFNKLWDMYNETKDKLSRAQDYIFDLKDKLRKYILKDILIKEKENK